MSDDRRAVNTGRIADLDDSPSFLLQEMKKPVTSAEPHSPQIKVVGRMGEMEFAIERDASRPITRTPQGKRFQEPALLAPPANEERPKEGEEEAMPVVHLPHGSTSIVTTDHVTYDSSSQLPKEELSVHSIMNQSSFMPLPPGPRASGQEANMRMAYVPKVPIQVPPAMPTLATSNSDPSQLCSPVSCLKFGSFDAAHFSFDAEHFSSAHFSWVASAMHPPVPATDSSQQFQEWQSVCRNNQERHPDPYALFPMDVYNRDSFWPYPG
ncbi:TPA: hypothetical protein ACH3X3_003569 [Trebouxia sp. C0006]